MQNDAITQSKQFFRAANRILGVNRIARHWRKATRQAYRWAADPATCEDTENNPLELLSGMFNQLREADRLDVVESALRLLSEPVGYQVIPANIPGETRGMI